MISDDIVKKIAAFDSEGAHVTTCYLNVDGKENLRHADVQTRLDELIRQTDLLAGDEPSVAADLDQIRAYVRAGFDRKGVGAIAMFACSPRDYWEVVSLPLPVQSRLIASPTPALGPLESVVQELEPIGVLLADRQRSRLFVFTTGSLVDHSETIEELPRDYDIKDQAARGDTRSHFDELVMQHYRQVAKAAFDLFHDRGVGRVTLGGAPEAMTEIEKLLHPYLRERLAPRIPVVASASQSDVRDAVLALQTQIERAHEAEVVERLRDAVGAGQRGVAGLARTLDAVSENRVQTLVVSDGYADSGWRCPASGTLAAIGPHCPACGEKMVRVENVIEHAVSDTFARSGQVEICVGNADLDVMGRIGAILRY